MSIGGAFPPDLRRATATRLLRPGAVLKLVATLDDGVQKEKRFVVIAVDGDVLVCVMNTQIHPIIQANEHLLRCQVKLEATHVFVDYECHVDCSRLRAFRTADVTQQLADQPRRHLGNIPEDVRDQIRAALQQARTLSATEVRTAVEALDAITFG